MEVFAQRLGVNCSAPLWTRPASRGISLSTSSGRRTRTRQTLQALPSSWAVQEQLGLKLEPQKGSVEILVIDRARKTSEN